MPERVDRRRELIGVRLTGVTERGAQLDPGGFVR
jgi:hypothetical protein